MKTIEETAKELMKTIEELAKELTLEKLVEYEECVQVEGHLTTRRDINPDGIHVIRVEGKTTCGESIMYEYDEISLIRYHFKIF